MTQLSAAGVRTDHSFEISATPAEAWKALEQLRVNAAGPGDWWLPGYECSGSEVEVEPERRLTVRKLDEPCAGSLIAVTFKNAVNGTRVRVVQSGFDKAFVRFAGETFFLHAAHLVADMQLFLETGVVAQRAWLPWTPLGIGIATEPYGLRVSSVQRGTWADRVGMQVDDVLLTVAGAPVYVAGELGIMERIVKQGDDLAATWACAGERREATATV